MAIGNLGISVVIDQGMRPDEQLQIFQKNEKGGRTFLCCSGIEERIVHDIIRRGSAAPDDGIAQGKPESGCKKEGKTLLQAVTQRLRPEEIERKGDDSQKSDAVFFGKQGKKVEKERKNQRAAFPVMEIAEERGQGQQQKKKGKQFIPPFDIGHSLGVYGVNEKKKSRKKCQRPVFAEPEPAEQVIDQQSGEQIKQDIDGMADSRAGTEKLIFNSKADNGEGAVAPSAEFACTSFFLIIPLIGIVAENIGYARQPLPGIGILGNDESVIQCIFIVDAVGIKKQRNEGQQDIVQFAVLPGCLCCCHTLHGYKFLSNLTKNDELMQEIKNVMPMS